MAAARRPPRTTRLVPAGVFLLSLLLLWTGMDRTSFGLLDEGLIVYGAERVLQGDRQYRDFWSLYGPGQFWTVAALFKLFGPSLLVERLWDAVAKAAIATLAFLITERIAPARLALLAALLCIAWMSAIGAHGNPLVPATLCAFTAAHLVIRHLGEPGARWRIYAAGIAVALTATFRHDVGAVVFLGTAAVLAAARERKALGAFGLATLLGYLPVAAYLLLAVPFADLVEQLFTYPATIYRGVRSLPYPSLSALFGSLADVKMLAASPLQWAWLASGLWAFYFPFVATAFAGLAWIGARRKGAEAEGTRAPAGIALLAALTAMLLLLGLVRPTYVQLFHALMFSLVLGAVLVAGLAGLGYRSASRIMAAALCSMALFPAARAVLNWQNADAEPSHGKALAEGRGSGFYIPADQADAIHYIREQVREGEAIFVGGVRHDIAMASDVMFHFLSARGSATRFHEFQPGVVTTARVQARIIDELERRRVSYVVLFRGFDNVREPNLSSKSTGVRLLDDYLASHFEEVREFGRYSIRKRR